MVNNNDKKNSEVEVKGPVAGIDLGTTNSCATVMMGGKVEVIDNTDGKRITPSVVSYVKEEDRFVVGEDAVRRIVSHPSETFVSVKRDMGVNLEKDEEMKKKYSVRTSSGEVKQLSPREISAEILRYMKTIVENKIGQKVERVVITVPAYFKEKERRATIDAGLIAGFKKVERIINEPTSAALAYGLDKKKNEKILVYDLGGGTFDVSVLEISEGVIKVLYKDGNRYLGGDDIDKIVYEWIVEKFEKESGLNLKTMWDKNKKEESLKAIRLERRLIRAARNAKETLSAVNNATINEDFVAVDKSGNPLSIVDYTFTEAEFRSLIKEPVLDKTWELTEKTIDKARIKSYSEFTNILLVGGSTRIPAVREMLSEKIGKDPSRSINPDEVVAYGAAVQGAIIGGDAKDVLLLDTTPLTLGIEASISRAADAEGIMVPIIPKNTTIPAKKTKSGFTTKVDNQESVEIKIYQGESKLAKRNSLLDKFTLAGIQKAPAGVPQIEVTFDIDSNSLLKVSAKDLASDKKEEITVESSKISGLSEKEVERMIRDAEINAEKDKDYIEKMNLLNQAQGMVDQINEGLANNKDKKDSEQVKGVEKIRDDFKKMIEKKDYDGIKSKLKAMSDAVAQLSRMQQEKEKVTKEKKVENKQKSNG